MEILKNFVLGMTGSGPLEIVAFFFGLATVGLLMLRSIWNYPFGLAMVTIYGVLFFQEKLYSDMLLQGFFFVLQVYGWWYWLQGNRAADGHINVRLVPRDHYKYYGGAAIIGTLALGTFMAQATNAALPYPDATTTVLSVIAQILLARRYLENWIIWIAVDVLAMGIYAVKGLYPTTVLYGIFLCMSIAGFILWNRIWKERVVAEGARA